MELIYESKQAFSFWLFMIICMYHVSIALKEHYAQEAACFRSHTTTHYPKQQSSLTTISGKLLQIQISLHPTASIGELDFYKFLGNGVKKVFSYFG